MKRKEKIVKFIAAMILVKLSNKQISTYKIAKKLNISFKTAYRYKKILNNIDLEKLKNLLFS